MQTFDVVLKLLLQRSQQLLPHLAGITVAEWLPTELPRLQKHYLDLLGRASDGTLLHVERQSANDALMHLRMAEYSLIVYRLHSEFPIQIVLYVGREPFV